MRSFERVTGPKVDKWLVQMVGLLAATIGVTLLVGARREQRVDDAVLTLAIGSAGCFAAIDLVHAVRGRISPVYLGDAVCELLTATTLVRTKS